MNKLGGLLVGVYRDLFDEESVWIGWSIYWRFQLISFLVVLPLSLLLAIDALAFVAGIATVLATVMILGAVVKRVTLGLPALPLSMFTFYVGWATFWRYVLVGLPGLLLVVVVVGLVETALKAWWVVIPSIPLLVLWFSACLGWAAGRIRKLLAEQTDPKPNV